jgi:hypothetical protein
MSLQPWVGVAQSWYCKRLFDPTRLSEIEEASLKLLCAFL